MTDILKIIGLLSFIIFGLLLSAKTISFICIVPRELIAIKETLQRIEQLTRTQNLREKRESIRGIRTKNVNPFAEFVQKT